MSEWITDRLPTEADADDNFLVWRWIRDDDDEVWTAYYKDIKTGEVWAPKPKPVPPKPYVKPKRWKPEIGERYHYVTSRAKIYSGIYEQAYDMYEAGNCFQTKAQAQEAARRVRELLLNYHKELNNE